MRHINILLVDDQVLFVRSLKSVLEADASDIRIVGIAQNGFEAIELTEKIRPDVILMDVRMPELDGVHATRAIMERHPEIDIIMLTTFDDDEYVFEAIEHGAKGYLLKNIPPFELITSIRAIREGALLMDPKIAKRLVKKANLAVGQEKFRSEHVGTVHAKIHNLSEREREVLVLIATGLGNKQIAERLFIADSTVRNHVTVIYSKLNVDSRFEAMQIAKEAGIV
jgi:DNA-binding NarL/FixJ family response regulator